MKLLPNEFDLMRSFVEKHCGIHLDPGKEYLIETRLSGALVKPKSAVVIRKVATASTEVSPKEPTYVASTGVVTIPTQTGVKYESPKGTAVTGTVTVSAGSSKEFFAVPDTGYYFATNADDQWTFTRK